MWTSVLATRLLPARLTHRMNYDHWLWPSAWQDDPSLIFYSPAVAAICQTVADRLQMPPTLVFPVSAGGSIEQYCIDHGQRRGRGNSVKVMKMIRSHQGSVTADGTRSCLGLVSDPAIQRREGDGQHHGRAAGAARQGSADQHRHHAARQGPAASRGRATPPTARATGTDDELTARVALMQDLTARISRPQSSAYRGPIAATFILLRRWSAHALV
jgi:hypothetical protein